MKDYLTSAIRLLPTKEIGPLAGIRIWNGACMIANTHSSYTTYIDELHRINALVDARKFIAAVRGANWKPTVKQTEKFIAVAKDKFRARIQLQDTETYPVFAVKGTSIDIGVDTFNTLQLLKPFISKNKAYPWACGIYFDGDFVYATNNIVLIRKPFKTPRPFILPSTAFDELVRLPSPVTDITITPNAIRFGLENNIAFHSLLTDSSWPNTATLFSSTHADPIPEGMKTAVESMVPLCDGMKLPKINLHANGMSTEEGSTAAKVEGFNFSHASFHAKPLLDVLNIATEINFASYPSPCYFRGNNGIEGVLVGLR